MVHCNVLIVLCQVTETGCHQATTAIKLGLIECCQTTAEEFPIGLTEVTKQVNLKADAGMYFDIPWFQYQCSEFMPSPAERALRVHRAEQLHRCFENYYERILKIRWRSPPPGVLHTQVRLRTRRRRFTTGCG